MSRTTPNGSLPTAQNGNEPARRLDLSGAQVGASALSAVTAALGASFFGVGGTVAGAAFGAVVSTVAGAVYTHSLSRASDRLKESSQVLVRRVPAAGRTNSPAASPPELEPGAAAARAMPQPSDPATRPMSTSGDSAATRAVPPSVERPGEDLTEPVTIAVPGPDAADETRLMPAVESEPVYAADSGAGGSDEPPEESLGDESVRPPVHKRHPFLVLAAIAAAGFAIAIGAITFIELVIDRPVSGGTGGTSIGGVVRGPSTTEEPTEQPTEEPTEEVTEEPTQEPTEEPTEEVTEGPTPAPAEQQQGDPLDDEEQDDGTVEPTG